MTAARADATVADTEIHFEIDIDAPLEAVWRAFTHPRELTRWLPIQARVSPGVGGSMSWGWGEGRRREMDIEAWTPPRHLRLAEAGSTVDVSLELWREGLVNVSLVQAGLPEAALEDASQEWTFYLRALRHSLERHPGSDRRCAWTVARTELARESVWERLLEVDAFPLQAERLERGAPFAMSVPSGRKLSGTLLTAQASREVSGVAGELGDGIVRLTSRVNEAAATELAFWAMTFTGEGDIEELVEEARQVFVRLFGPRP